MSRATRIVRATVAALENCICLESLTRARIDKKGKMKQEERDTLQIEVTTIGDREWFSWPGQADSFVQDPASLVGFGMMNTGQLTTNLKTIFLDGAASRKFRGAGTLDGRPGFEFDYTVSSAFLHYTLSNSKMRVSAGMQGTFRIDRESGELLALSTEATEIPPDFDVRRVRTDVTYAPFYLDGQRVVLPLRAVTRVDHADGSASMNHVEFSHCRPYAVTSSISFDAPPDPAAAPHGPPANPAPPSRHEAAALPPGMALLMRIEKPISARTAIGDRIGLVMQADARHQGEVAVEKGARVDGRVRWIQTSACPEPCLFVAVELISAAAKDGTSRPVYARLSQVHPDASVKLTVSTAGQTITSGPLGLRRTETSGLSIEAPDIPGVGSFFVLTPELTTPPHVTMLWETESPRTR